jgi:very-short-patch-repair endonuclease
VDPKGPITPLREQIASPSLDWKTRFKIIASKASRRNRNKGVYSITEHPIRSELIRVGLKEGRDFVHEYRIIGYSGVKGQAVYYWLDFYIPNLRLGIEADGEIWHTFFDSAKRDKRRDSLIMNNHGIRVVRLSPFQLRDKRIKTTIARIIMDRCIELILGNLEGEKKNRIQIEPFLKSLI